MDITLVDSILYCVQVVADCLLQWQDECIEWGRGVALGSSDFNRLMLLRNVNWLMLLFSHCSDQQDCADSDLPFSLPLPGRWSATGWQTRCESLYCFMCQFVSGSQVICQSYFVHYIYTCVSFVYVHVVLCTCPSHFPHNSSPVHFALSHIPYSGKFSLVQNFTEVRPDSSEEVFTVFIFAEWCAPLWPHPHQLMATPHMRTEEMTLND